jgi:serine/threonine protein kinase
MDLLLDLHQLLDTETLTYLTTPTPPQPSDLFTPHPDLFLCKSLVPGQCTCFGRASRQTRSEPPCIICFLLQSSVAFRETLSLLGMFTTHTCSRAKDFLRACLQPDPKLRPGAADLLHHPFVSPEVPIQAGKAGILYEEFSRLYQSEGKLVTLIQEILDQRHLPAGKGRSCGNL